MTTPPPNKPSGPASGGNEPHWHLDLGTSFLGFHKPEVVAKDMTWKRLVALQNNYPMVHVWSLGEVAIEHMGLQQTLGGVDQAQDKVLRQHGGSQAELVTNHGIGYWCQRHNCGELMPETA